MHPSGPAVLASDQQERLGHQMPLIAIGARLRAICLKLPEATEELMRRGPSYRVADKIFALERSRNDGLALWCKVPAGSREIFIGAEPGRFFIPPYFGAKGWIGVGLDEAADWLEIESFIRRSYRLVAPARLANLMV
jgi:predicted DNA-binding protein (MmcQ/YjbR family)